MGPLLTLRHGPCGLARPTAPRLTEVRLTLDVGLALAAGAPLQERIAADVAFHAALYALSGNTAIGETVAAQWPHFMRSMALVLDDAAMRLRVWSEHAAIFDAVMAGDAMRAANLARRHADASGDETARRLDTPEQQTA